MVCSQNYFNEQDLFTTPALVSDLYIYIFCGIGFLLNIFRIFHALNCWKAPESDGVMVLKGARSHYQTIINPLLINSTKEV